MKRFFMFVTAVILIFSLTACGGSSDKKNLQKAALKVVPPMLLRYCMNIGTKPKHTAETITAATPKFRLFI